MEDFQTPLTNKLPLKEDNESCLNIQKHEISEFCSISNYNCECVEMLLKNETSIRLFKNEKSWFITARLMAIKFILGARELYGLHFATAYMSLIYFYRCFSKTVVTDVVRRGVAMIAVACLSLAAKMEEGPKAPPLSKYGVVDCPHVKNTVREMELLVLSTLEWKMKCVTPFDYIHYFVIKFFGKIGNEEEIIIERATELVLAVMGEINAAEQRPSIIAAAAVLAAYDRQITKTKLEETINNGVPWWGSSETEETFICYKLMHGQRFESLSISDYDCECVKMFIKNETDSQFQVRKNEKSWFESARLDAIKWILDSRDFYGLQFTTAYKSLIYFDRVFLRETIDDGNLWGVGAIAVACLSLAAKMEERRKAPPLSKYQIAGLDLEKNTIEMMELVVLKTLEWKMNCVTPFDYIHYFVNVFIGISRRQEDIVSRAVELIMTVMGEINASEQRPSILAAAAVLAAYDHRLTKTTLEIKMSVVRSLQKEHTFSCYKLMQNIVQAKSQNSLSKTPSTSVDASKCKSVMCNEEGETWRFLMSKL